MTIRIELPNELIARIDQMTDDRDGFIEAAVRQLLGESRNSPTAETDRIDELADELNREAADVLEYQVIA